MPPKKATGSAVTGKKSTSQRRKSSKVCKRTTNNAVKPLKRSLKRTVIQNQVEVAHEQLPGESTNSHSIEDGSSSNTPVAKKRRVTQSFAVRPIATRSRTKSIQAETSENDVPEPNKKKYKFGSMNIVRTVVNDYKPDRDALDDENLGPPTTHRSDENLGSPTIHSPTKFKVNDNFKPYVKLNKFKNDGLKIISNSYGEYSLVNKKTTDEGINPESNLEINSSISLQSPPITQDIHENYDRITNITDTECTKSLKDDDSTNITGDKTNSENNIDLSTNRLSQNSPSLELKHGNYKSKSIATSNKSEESIEDENCVSITPGQTSFEDNLDLSCSTLLHSPHDRNGNLSKSNFTSSECEKSFGYIDCTNTYTEQSNSENSIDLTSSNTLSQSFPIRDKPGYFKSSSDISRSESKRFAEDSEINSEYNYGQSFNSSLPKSKVTRNTCNESGLDKLHFLDNLISKLYQYSGYSYEINVDLTSKKLHSQIQKQELKIVTSGGIIPTSLKKVDEEHRKKNHELSLQLVAKSDKERMESEDFTRFMYSDDDDDDDTISLFAESLSSFDTSNKITYSPNIDKYEPIIQDSVFKVPKPKYDVPRSSNQVCEKKYADSTSTSGVSKVYALRENPIHTTFKKKIMPPIIKPHISLTSAKSFLFKGICKFNIMNTCKNPKCNFRHIIPSDTFLSEKIIDLNQDQFYEESLIVGKTPELLRLYGLVFINESIRRHNTKVLMEITVKILKYFDYTDNNSLVTEVVERTLLYLNGANLATVSLLNSEFKPGVQVCDKFMEVIGQTQNFSRFKTVFKNLAILMCTYNRKFDSEVVCQVLERVNILPYSNDLAQALINMIQLTDAKVFSNATVKAFQRKLLQNNKQLLEDLLRIEEANLCRARSIDIDDGDKLWNADNSMRYSPDTTNKDLLDRQENMEVRNPDLGQIRHQNFLPNPYPGRGRGRYLRNSYGNQSHRLIKTGLRQSIRPVRPQMIRMQRWPTPNWGEGSSSQFPSPSTFWRPVQNKPRRKSGGPYR